MTLEQVAQAARATGDARAEAAVARLQAEVARERRERVRAVAAALRREGELGTDRRT